MTPQSTEQITNHVQLPIIEVPHKNQIPISLARMVVPHLLNRSISMHGKDKKMVETLGQRSISAPTVFPEFDFGALPNQKGQIFLAPFRFFHNLLLDPNSGRPTNLLSPPPIILLPIFHRDHLFPKVIPFTCKPPSPLAQ